MTCREPPWRGGNNPYDAGWVQALKTVQGGDHVYAAIINERGLLNGEPVIDFTIRPYSLLSDKRTDYDAAVQAKLEKQRQALDRLLKDTAPAKGTEIIGFLHAAAQILGAYPARTIRQVIVWTDSLQEGDEVNLAKLPLTDDQIAAIIEGERQAGRLPRLSGMSIWFVTGPSVPVCPFRLKQTASPWKRSGGNTFRPAEAISERSARCWSISAPTDNEPAGVGLLMFRLA